MIESQIADLVAALERVQPAAARLSDWGAQLAREIGRAHV